MGHRYFAPDLSNIQLTEPNTYDPNRAYAHAQTANIYFSSYISRHFSPVIIAFSLHPGGIWTGLQSHLPDMVAMKSVPAVQKYMKSPAQGAATTVWAAVGRCWEGRKGRKGGLYLEDYQVSPPVKEKYELLDRGYKRWAYDVEGQERLWEISNGLVGFVEG